MKRVVFLIVFFQVFRSFGYDANYKRFARYFCENICSSNIEFNTDFNVNDNFQELYIHLRNVYLKDSDKTINDFIINHKEIEQKLNDCDLILKTIERLWSNEHAQRKSGPLSIHEMVELINSLSELKNRIEDFNDPLIDIINYKRLLLIPSFSGQIYNWVQELYFRGQWEKARDCFPFFILPENSDDFTRGAAHFFIGRITRSNIKETDDILYSYNDAIYNFLLTQRYATCLTYISYAYIWAADIYATLGYKKQALALIMVDVPSVDFAMMKKIRHSHAYLLENNRTNIIKHIQEWMRYGDENDNYPHFLNDTLWQYCITNRLNAYDRNIAIEEALNDKREVIPCYELLTEALLHPWPSIYDIPESIATNRVLNNNIFNH